ncbi:hypothetical protein [Burkholderia territorii]|uniref:hypothetical protein n=1 Tax=Burkholderia territorii TaxID=1503055 RepID=UPI0012D9428E|nr:hypothetical protein [Burkholderia territorii]
MISAKDLQALAEDMAAITCPHMFEGELLYRQGRSINGQTTKNWPDAYVLTGSNIVHGIEATRDQQSWTKHLAADLEKARDRKNFQLSGYFFVGGYPDHDPPEADIQDWTQKFIALGIEAKNVALLIGKHLAFELASPKYARIRQVYLNLASSPEYFEEIRQSIIRKFTGALVSPTDEDLRSGIAFKPVIAESVKSTLIANGACEVRGPGACGKTTLANWIGMSPGFLMTPIYKLDLATWGDDIAVGKLQNEMTALCGKDVLFIVDNVHLGEGAARALVDYWRLCCKPLGSRLLLLGRVGGYHSQFPGVSHQLHMKAGAAEMTGIVRFLTTKVGKPVTSVPKPILREWARTFGGKLGQSSVGVDLIAFSAAVETRTIHLAKGDWRLSETDAIGAVQHHYLRPIQGENTRANLMRLATLSELEFPIPAHVLPFPTTGFGRECIDRGLVIERKGAFSLAHPALGRLLSAAANTDVSGERLAAAANSAVLAARMLARGLFSDERADLLEKLRESLTTGQWMDSCDRLSDVGSVLSVGVRLGLADPLEIDSVVRGDRRLEALSQRVRSLETFTSVAGRLRTRGLTLTASRLLDITDPVIGRTLDDNLMQGSTGQVLAFLKNLESPEVVCAAIDRRMWTLSRERAAIDFASSTAQLARFVGGVGQPDLATAPALQFILRSSLSNLLSSDLGDVSNIVRYATAGNDVLRAFFDRLIATDWLPQAYLETILGQLCGSLMSFANHLPSNIRQTILLPQIRDRIVQEERQLDNGGVASVARFTCLLGAASALWGADFQPVAWQWPLGLSIAEVYDSRAPLSTNGEGFGMYELQFWLGLRWLSINGRGLPAFTEHALAESFLRRLEIGEPPSGEAMLVQSDLAKWLKDRQASGWRLPIK